jgi:transcriptional regulator with XRE-family HTH domain
LTRPKRAATSRRESNNKVREPVSQAPTGDTAATKPPIDQRAGAAIRRGRLERNLTLSDLAAAADMSVPMLSRIENGQSTASLTVLERLCAVLGTNLASLFHEIEQASGTAQLLKAADQMEVVRTGTKHGHSYRLLSYHRGPRKVFEPFLIEMDRESESYPRFQHEGTEFIYMLSGRMEYRFGDRTFCIEPGDAFTFSGNIRHGPERLLDDRIQFISIIVYAE